MTSNMDNGAPQKLTLPFRPKHAKLEDIDTDNKPNERPPGTDCLHDFKPEPLHAQDFTPFTSTVLKTAFQVMKCHLTRFENQATMCMTHQEVNGVAIVFDEETELPDFKHKIRSFHQKGGLDGKSGCKTTDWFVELCGNIYENVCEHLQEDYEEDERLKTKTEAK